MLGSQKIDRSKEYILAIKNRKGKEVSSSTREVTWSARQWSKCPVATVLADESQKTLIVGNIRLRNDVSRIQVAEFGRIRERHQSATCEIVRFA